jgi:uncharacterized protein involved in tellurium resistance
MPILESQLETWSHRSQTTTAVRAHEDIRAALKAPLSPVRGVDFEDYLQGSYRNYTNTVRDHDVDIVLQLNTCYTSDFSLLSYQDAAPIQRLALPAIYSLTQFHPAVVETLGNALGWYRVSEGNKSIKVAGSPGVRLDADVIVAQQHRLYYATVPYPQYVEGISLYHRVTGRLVVNYPKQHYANGIAKQTNTNGWFKPTVRIFKNARSYMVDHGILAEDVATSYFLQGLLYNVPDEIFGGGVRLNFLGVLIWLAENIDQFERFVCQNRLIPLFGVSDEQWQVSRAVQFLLALLGLNRTWR